MPIIDDLNERFLCTRTPLCPNLVEVKGTTKSGRIIVRNVCSWHHRHDTDDVPSAVSAGAPLRGGVSFIPRNCAFPSCKKTSTSIGLRQERKYFSKWCSRHRDKNIRNREFAQNPRLFKLYKKQSTTSKKVLPSPVSRPQSALLPKKERKSIPVHKPGPDISIQLPNRPNNQKMLSWRHGPAVALNHAIIDPLYPGGRVVMNDSGYVVWATIAMVGAMDVTLQHGHTSLEACRRSMQRVAPTKYWPKKSNIAGDTTPRVTTALILLLQAWLQDPDRRKQLKRPPLPKILAKLDRVIETLTNKERLQRVIDILEKWRDNPHLINVEATLTRDDLEPRIVESGLHDNYRSIVYQVNPDFSIVNINIRVRLLRND
jgi:hypothetical protein